jgi:hypothetical protein
MMRMNSDHRPLMTLLILVTICQLPSLQAALSCDSDAFCQTMYNSNETSCLNQTCSNPFQHGCLRAKLGEKWNRRLCNSDDDPTQRNSVCDVSSFKDVYPEVRIHQGDWPTSLVMAWIYQITLSELAGIPSTVGLTSTDTKLASFYSQKSDLSYSKESYPYGAL